jgi:YVTN family beta-propeller protein
MAYRTQPAVGDTLAGYRIDAFVGSGGMGDVYRAFDTRLNRNVALKLLAPRLADDEGFRRRFLRESLLAASLDHPNAIPVYEAGEADGLLFIAMRFVEGTDLRQVLDVEGVLEPKRALALLAPVAGALDTAHAKGLVHRDVKPANILVASEPAADPPEHVYLSDFGLTTLSSDPGGGPFSGTADYAAPELVTGGPVDGRTDVYALGCVIFECLTGDPPFHGDSVMAVLWGHANDPVPSASERNGDLPEAIDAVLRRALAKSPDERYSTCRELVEALRAALGLDAASPRRRRRGFALTLALALLAGAAIPGVLLTRGRGSTATTAITVDSLQRIDPHKNALAATLATGTAPAGVVTGSGRVWVINNGDRTLTAIDPKRNKVARTIRLGITPARIAAGGGGIWMTTTSEGRPGRWLWKYDLRTNSAGPLPLDLISDGVTYGAGDVWVTDVTHQPSSLLRVRPHDGKPLGYVPACSCGAPVFGEGAIWTIAGGAGDWLYRLDPKTRNIIARIDLGFSAWSGRTAADELAVGAGSVWVADPLSDSVTRIDPVTNRPNGTFPTGRQPSAIAVGEGAVWVANSRDGTVTRYDPKTADIATIRVGGTPVGLAVGQGAVWVVTQAR